MFSKIKSMINKDPLASLTKKLTNLVEAIGESQISAENYELPQLMELQLCVAHCNTLAKDKEPYQHRLKETLETLPAIHEYFTDKTGALHVISALHQLENEIKQLLPNDRPKVR
jgi:hypothetical protein